jgi:uncharacterized membrane protein YgdD (TMEM256/DUF423 family)
MLKKLPLIGSLGIIGVAFGALGAHTLKNKISTGLITTDQVNGFDTGVKYQMYHVLAMLAIVILSQNYSHKYLKWAFNFFLWGIVCFSGSLYLLCTRNLFGAEWLRFLGPVTPIGGVLFIAGWLFLAFSVVKKS